MTLMAPESLAGSRVLVVEDEALIALEIQDRLTRSNYRVVGVEDTAEGALALVNRLRPDLVLMDVRLKGKMDGIEAAAHIREHLDIPVVYLTAHSDHATLQRAKATAPLGYVLKPFQERDLLVTIEMAIHRHALERQIKDSELRYATTLASIGDAVLATDKEGRVTLLNPMAEALTGWHAVDAQGMPVSQVMVTADEATRAPVENPIHQALRRCEIVRLEQPVLLIARDGVAIPIDDSAAPIMDRQGRLTGAVVAFRDIRQRRLTEDALRRAEEQLRQAQKMEAIGRLAGGIAHDFNNLLTIINGNSELPLQSGVDDDTRDLLEEVQNAGKRSAALTRQLLAFGRRQILEPRILDLNDLVAGVNQMLRRLIGEDVRLTLTLSPGLPSVRADPSQLEQVIMNLAVNARDSMPRGGQLTIETSCQVFEEPMVKGRPEMPRGRYVMLGVSDTGVGMNESTKARLFEPFFTTKEPGKGAGLGLATVYGIVKQSAGYIYVYSEPDRGSTFKIYLPAMAESDAVDEDLVETESPLQGHETVLLVEDEDGVRNVASLALRKYGYRVLAAASAREAIARYLDQPESIALLITDVVMPGLSGSRLAEQLLAVRPDLRVLYVSGYTDDAVVRHGVLQGEAAFLQKPFTAIALARKVREILDKPS